MILFLDLNDASLFHSFHYSCLFFILQIHYINKRGTLHSVNLNEMIPDFHVNCTWFRTTYYTLFFLILFKNKYPTRHASISVIGNAHQINETLI